MKPWRDPSIQEQFEVTTEVMEETPWQIIVWNDEVNTFDWVIETLVQICGHTREQAEQCAYLIHYGGKHAVKNGFYEDLKPACEAILDRGIQATLESTAE